MYEYIVATYVGLFIFYDHDRPERPQVFQSKSKSFGIISYGNVTRNETTYKLHFVERRLLYDLIISHQTRK